MTHLLSAGAMRCSSGPSRASSSRHQSKARRLPPTSAPAASGCGVPRCASNLGVAGLNRWLLAPRGPKRPWGRSVDITRAAIGTDVTAGRWRSS
jgi:hypothetical protein